MSNDNKNRFLRTFVSIKEEKRTIEIAEHYTSYLPTLFSFSLLFERLAVFKCPLTAFTMGSGDSVLLISAALLCLKCFFNGVVDAYDKEFRIIPLLIASAYLLAGVGIGLLSAELLGANIKSYAKTIPYGLLTLGMLLFTFAYLKKYKKKSFLFFMQTIGAIFLLMGAFQTSDLSALSLKPGTALKSLNWSICVFSAFAGIAAFLTVYLDDAFLRKVLSLRRVEYSATPFLYPRRIDDNCSSPTISNDDDDFKNHSQEKKT